LGSDRQPLRFAYVGANAQVHVRAVGQDGPGPSQQVSWTTSLSAMTGWGGGPGGVEATWPCWAPGQARVACFVASSAETGTGTQIALSEVDGVHEHRLPVLDGRMAIHLQWSPDARKVAVLVQHDELLEVWVSDATDPSAQPRLVAEGSPLFFAWWGDGRGLVLHVGDGSDGPARLELRDVDGDGDDVVFRIPPGSFCAPLTVPSPTGERVVYVIPRADGSQLVSADLEGEDVLGLVILPGLVAAVAEPGGDRIACAGAPDADGSPYEGVWVVPADGRAPPRQVVTGPLTAFFWRPGHDAIIYACWDTGRRQLHWRMAAFGEEPVDIAVFRPTRDTYFHLHFFEQFVASHPLVSPCGRWLVWAGHVEDEDEPDPFVHLADLSVSPPAVQRVERGSYAVFAPR